MCTIDVVHLEFFSMTNIQSYGFLFVHLDVCT